VRVRNSTILMPTRGQPPIGPPTAMLATVVPLSHWHLSLLHKYCRRNPQNGVISFDTFPWALLNVYVVVSVSNWIYIQMPLWSSTSASCMAFFVTLIVFGTYFALSLVLVSHPHVRVRTKPYFRCLYGPELPRPGALQDLSNNVVSVSRPHPQTPIRCCAYVAQAVISGSYGRALSAQSEKEMAASTTEAPPLLPLVAAKSGGMESATPLCIPDSAAAAQLERQRQVQEGLESLQHRMQQGLRRLEVEENTTPRVASDVGSLTLRSMPHAAPRALSPQRSGWTPRFAELLCLVLGSPCVCLHRT
jgi:hypothetical protein